MNWAFCLKKYVHLDSKRWIKRSMYGYLLVSLEFSVPGTDDTELLLSFKRRSVETSMLEKKLVQEFGSLFSATKHP